ncbi:MAG: 30S ribosomal protein S13 [Candidatus Micrarchaeia archaeon]
MAKPGAQKAAGKGPQAQVISQELKKQENANFNGIVRVAGQDLKGHLTLDRAFRRIKGVGHNLASNIAIVAREQFGLNADELVGNLTDEQLTKLEDLLKDPAKHGIKSFMLNRQRELETNRQAHLVGTDLDFARRQDIEREKRERTWRGWRHSIGQKVRGQHTRTTGRSGMSVGVLKKAAKAQKGAAAEKAQDSGKSAAKEKK